MIYKYCKVVTEDMKSLGLRRNPNILTYEVNKWIKEKNPIKNKLDCGGIWVTKNISQAKHLLKYLSKKAEKENKPEFKRCRCFNVMIGDILYENTYRIKTNKVKFINEIK